jgi:hypothetical protein
MSIRSRVGGLSLRRGLNRAFIAFRAGWVVYWVVVFHWSEANNVRRELAFKERIARIEATWVIPPAPPSFVPDEPPKTLPADSFSQGSSAPVRKGRVPKKATAAPPAAALTPDLFMASKTAGDIFDRITAQTGAARAGPIHEGSGFWHCFKLAFRKSLLKSEPPGVEFTAGLVGPLLLYFGAVVLGGWIVRGFRPFPARRP